MTQQKFRPHSITEDMQIAVLPNCSQGPSVSSFKNTCGSLPSQQICNRQHGTMSPFTDDRSQGFCSKGGLRISSEVKMGRSMLLFSPSLPIRVIFVPCSFGDRDMFRACSPPNLRLGDLITASLVVEEPGTCAFPGWAWPLLPNSVPPAGGRVPHVSCQGAG